MSTFFSVPHTCFTLYRAENSHIKTALQDFGTARVIKDPNKAFLVEIISIQRERERQSGTLSVSAVFLGRLRGGVYVSGLLRACITKRGGATRGIYEISTK